MNELIRRIAVLGLAVAVLGVAFGCSKPETDDVQAETDKINKGLEGQPDVPPDLANMSLSDDPNAPPAKGKGGGGP